MSGIYVESTSDGGKQATELRVLPAHGADKLVTELEGAVSTLGGKFLAAVDRSRVEIKLNHNYGTRF